VRATDLLSRLRKVRRAGPDSWQALCPAHDDHQPSLSIREADGKILLRCHAGCSTERIVAALGLSMADLFEEPPRRERLPAQDVGGGREIVALYDYTDEEGNLLYQVVRYRPKAFAQRRPDGQGGWIWNLEGVRPVLYRLPQVRQAVVAGEPVFLVEGEKDVHSLEALGLCATTPSGGSGRWDRRLTEQLKLAHVIVIPDNDAAGLAAAAHRARSLWGRAASVKVVRLDVAEKGDVTDWLAAGHSKEELLELVAKTPRWEPEPQSPVAIHELPYNEDAERAVLAAMLASKEAIFIAEALLTPRAFWVPEHAVICEAILDLHGKGDPVDASLLRARLHERQLLQKAGGDELLRRLASIEVDPRTVRAHAKMVLDCWAYREQAVAWESYREGWRRTEAEKQERRERLLASLDLSAPAVLESVGIDELLRMDIEVRWLVRPLIPLTGVTVIAGDSRLGKSWLAVSLCHAVANGFRQWLGHWSIEQRGGAMYIDYELGLAGMKARLLDLDRGADVETPLGNGALKPEEDDFFDEEPEEPASEAQRPLRYFDAPVWHTAQIAALEHEVRRYHVKVIVIDTLADAAPPWTDIRSNSDMGREMQRLRRFAARVGCAIIVVHHRRKFQPGMDPHDLGSSVLGAQAIVSRADSVLMVTGRPDGPRIVSHEKSRFAEDVARPFYLEKLDGPHGGSILMRGDWVSETASERAEQAADAVRRLLQGGPMVSSDLAQAVAKEAGCSARLAKEVMAAMGRRQEVIRRREGRHVRYELAQVSGEEATRDVADA